MKFFTILRSFGLEREFVNLLRTVPKSQLDNLGLTKINIFKFREHYLGNGNIVQDVSVDSNANVSGKSPTNIRSEQLKPWNKIEGLYWFWRKAKKRFTPEHADHLVGEVLRGHLYIHDLTKWDQPYCFSYDMKRILTEGRPYARLVAQPSRRIRSFIGQCAEFGMDASQEQAGAVAFSSLALSTAVAVLEENKDRKEKVLCLRCGNELPMAAECGKCQEQGKIVPMPPVSDKDIENTFQNFVHIINNQFRVGGDSPFTNLSIFSTSFLEEMYGQNTYNGFTWNDVRPVVTRVQDIIMEFMARGDPSTGMMYRFPIVTINVRPSDVDTPEVESLLRKNSRGFFNVNRTDQVAMCCRLQMKKKERVSSLGTGGDNIGSLRIVTVNYPSVWYEHVATGEEIDQILERRYVDARDLLLCHLDVMRDLESKQFLKFLSIGWIRLEQFYLTLGVHGLAEFVEMEGCAMLSDTWLERNKNILTRLSTFCDSINEWDFNFEVVPAEGATRTMADSNKHVYGAKDVFYSNQFVPLYSDVDLNKRLTIESTLCDLVSGGTMTFINLDELGDEDAMLSLQKKIIKNTKIPQYAINIGMTRCLKCNANASGTFPVCPKCGGPVEIFTRIVGYFVPLSSWDSRRKVEFNTRKWYT